MPDTSACGRDREELSRPRLIGPPTTIWHARAPRRVARYLEMFKVATDEGQTVVENALEHLLVVPRPVIPATVVLAMIDTWRDLQRQWRDCPPLDVHLKDYGALLDGRKTGS